MGIAITLPILLFFIVDAAFFSANLAKVLEGGYVPLLVGAAIFAAMTTWRKGRISLFDRIAKENPRYEEFWEEMHCAKMPRVPGVAIYLTSRADRVPSSLKLNVKHNKCLHDTVVLLTVFAERIPRVPRHRHVVAEPLEHGFVRLALHYGFAETPNVPRSLRRAVDRKVDLGCVMDCESVSYFVGRAIPVPSPRPELAAWREPIFVFLTRNATSASNFFCIPSLQVVELGTFIEI